MGGKTCEWCGAEITAPKAKLYCSKPCGQKAYSHLIGTDIAKERRAARMDRLAKIHALCEALEAGGSQIDEEQLLDAGLLRWWSVTRCADRPEEFELVTAADRNASVPWALPPPRRGDKRWLVAQLRRLWLERARAYLRRRPNVEEKLRF